MLASSRNEKERAVNVKVLLRCSYFAASFWLDCSISRPFNLGINHSINLGSKKGWLMQDCRFGSDSDQPA
ncbi:hypothetical protein KFK09_015875 [Dendrobium nobile]|uniref:Uncharacterized protein n=1 Tax=Dendrobium nobile TaxID=94219 RepID=A0A8T3B779_DENNO|nr:hypothetical protein KFK09_015875 [Dendrobium nobile]